jgi:multiple sugar transport system permease protein
VAVLDPGVRPGPGAAGAADTAVADRSKPSRPPLRPWQRGGLVVAVALLAVLFTYPFAWLVSASLKPRPQVFDNRLVPETVQWSNYSTVWEQIPLLATWFLNTVIVGLAAAITVTFSSALVAFGFSYFRFRYRDALFGLVLATMMLPGAVTLVPTFVIWNELGLVGTQVPLWAQNIFGSAFYIFLIRQFFLTLPRELFDAGRVDGLGYFGLFRRIAVPLSRPVLIIAFVFELQASWTDLMRPLIYLRDAELYTLPRGLKSVLDRFGQGGEMQWELVLAANVLATIPMILLFLAAQRYFVQGIATTGQK